ncbi:TetR/AcrR family transcriptional regulator [Microbacterium sp. E-13]|uniref:TetR/AcrR family transcriptional regulator n=1 Tax=Microbacterium sp. E-13 TaxID=3404048 RepID=UPI003CEA67B4
MPKIVDHKVRKHEISVAAMRVLARSGPDGLTLRALARELNGSITLVTHFYADRQTLLEGIIDELSTNYDEDLASIPAGSDKIEDLRAYLLWMVPQTPEEIDVERCRVALVHSADNPAIARFFSSMEAKARAAFEERLEGLVAPPEVPAAVDFLRALVNGAVLSAVEHPEIWTPQRHRRVVDYGMSALGLERVSARD